MIIDRFVSEIEAASERYARQSDERARKREALDRHGILFADDREHVKQRLGRLSASWALARAIETKAGPPTADDRPISPREPAVYGADVLGLERLMGANDLVDVAFLERGALAARSVGRITARTGQGTQYGTGFLVSPNVLLTNHHVLASAGEAAASYVEFDYQAGADGLPLAAHAFALDPGRFFVTDKGLDFTLVGVAPRSAAGAELVAYGWLALIEQPGKVVVGELVNIVQHPDGEPKQLAMRENRIVDRLENFLHYATDTSPGSSGAPVFNDQWEVVALHHSGVPKTDEEGGYVAKDSTPWTPDRPETELAWVANEGVRVSRVLAELGRRELPAAADALRAELLQAAHAPRPRAALAAQPLLPAGPAVTAVDAATLLVPLRVTVSLGGAPSPASPSRTTPLPAMARGVADPFDSDVADALAAAEAARDRPYYQAEVDAAKRDSYYADIPDDLEGEAVFEALSKLSAERHTRSRGYDPKRHVYPWVDLHPDRQLRSIYSGKTFPPQELIRADARIEAARRRVHAVHAGVLEASPVDDLALEAANEPFNCEHVVPQSTFAKKEPMRGDLHHLFACESDCNSFRGNTPYFDFADFEEVVRSDCGRREGKDAAAKFEPSDGKGAVARATLYFLLRYPGLIGDRAVELQAAQLPLLLEWHRLEPVGEWERHRNAAVEESQGNRNPLIDHPEWAERIDFLAGFGSSP